MGAVSTGRRRRGAVLPGLLLVAVGVLLLLNTTGAISFGIWFELANYWPVLLALIGMELVLAQRAILIRVGAVVLTLAVTVGAAWLSMPEYDAAEPLRAAYVEPLGAAETLHLKMEFLGGSVELSSDTSGASSPTGLLTADFESSPARVIREQSGTVVECLLVSEGPFLRHSSVASDDKYTRRESRISFPVGLADWRLMVSPDVEVDIDISSGASDLDLDLRGLNVRRLSIEAGASDIRVQLPATAGQTNVDIAAGVADIEIVVPDDVAAKIDIAAPIGSVWVEPSRFMYTGDGYQSPHYFGAQNRVNIDIEALVADVTVR